MRPTEKTVSFHFKAVAQDSNCRTASGAALEAFAGQGALLPQHIPEFSRGKEKIMKKFFTKISSFVLCMALLVRLCFSAWAADGPATTNVRVGYISIQSFLYQDENGDYSGIAYELLREIGNHNNWTFTYYPCSYSDVEQLFADDVIDIFVPYQKTAQRAEQFEYSNEIFCTNRCSVLTLPDSPIDYQDFVDMDGCTVGVLSNTVNSTRVQQYYADHGCNIILKDDYISWDEMVRDAKDGTIDAFISASSRGITDFKIVAILPQTNSYVLGPKGNRTYLDPIDDAIQAITIEMPGFVSALDETYQESASGRYPSLSEEEKAYISKKGVVSVLVSPQECDENGEFATSAKVVFEHLSALTGLQFVPNIQPDLTQMMQNISAGTSDMMFTFNRDYDWAAKNNVWITGGYATFPNKLITNHSMQDIRTVAVVPGSYIAYWLSEKQQYQLLEYTSYQACIEAVLGGEADATYATSPIGNYYSTFPKYSRLSFVTAYDFSNTFCMAVSKQSDQILVDILNKALLCIPDTALNSAFETQITSRKISVEDYFYSNPVFFVAVLVGCVTVLLALVFSVFYLYRVRRKNKELAAANGAKTRFYSRMSHDMRTPMNGILGMAELSMEETDPAVVRENMGKIRESGAYLLGLINDTLDLQRMESGKLVLEPQIVSTQELILAGVEMVRRTAAEKGVTFQVTNKNADLNGYVRTDPLRMKQIFTNLLSNAVKFTPPGGTVELGFEVLARNGNMVHDRMTVTDTGLGMSKEFIEHGIFLPFSQEHNELTDTYAGSGLGLSIVKSLVDSMGATISVESELGVGTKFTIDIDFECVPPERAENQTDQAQKEKEAAMKKLQGKRLLLAEDHPLNAEIAMRLLSKAGCLPTWVKDGRECLEKFTAAKPHEYDAILMDIRMPNMDGLEAARAIRALATEEAKSIPILAMTANAYEEDVRSARKAGMNAHIAKPIDPLQLYQTLAALIAGECVQNGTEKRE